MSDRLDQSMTELFDLPPSTPPVIRVESVPAHVDSVGDEDPTMQSDAAFARKNIRSLIQQGSAAMQELLQVAKLSEHPRAYEVAAAMLKNLAELNKDLLEVHQRQKKLEEVAPVAALGAGPIQVDKAVFVGSTLQLAELLQSKVLETP